MKKTAIIYDKWLDTLGGGEAVACNLAKILINKNYEVTIACRKKIPVNTIKKKFQIDVSAVKFFQVWNDDEKIQELSRGKDLFINISFMDYSVGLAKKNIYYAHFPTQSYSGLKSYFFNEILLPNLVKKIKPIEFIDRPKTIYWFYNNLAYKIESKISIAFSYLNNAKIYKLKFFIFFETFSKTNIENVSFELLDAKLIKKIITFDHKHNVFKYLILFKPNSSTTNLILKKNSKDKSNVYIISPEIYNRCIVRYIFTFCENKLKNRLRAGIFLNVKNRIKQFDLIISHSKYVARWINNYWNCSSTILYPPVEMLFKKNEIHYSKKQNIICSVGRFFTLGHNKRQDIMIDTFKKMCDQGLKGWELHLAGGLNDEPTSLKYMEELKKKASKYPIKFIENQPRKKIVNLLIKSKIYWHAAGFNQNKKRNPINFEHFGIAAVEAISAGCVPVLYDGGGLPEIIDSINLNPELYLFNNVNELIKKTNYHINHYKEQFTKITLTHKKLNDIYSKESFKIKFLEILKNT